MAEGRPESRRAIRFSESKGRALTPGRIDRFLDALATGSEPAEAAEYADASLTTLYHRRKSDARFRAAWAEALEVGAQYAVAEARRRAIDGWLEPVFYKGVQVGSVRKFSDRMLELLLKARLPEFEERRQVSVGVVSLTGEDILRARGIVPQAGLAALEEVAGAFALAADAPEAPEPESNGG